jgi:hypothetical protein
VADEAVTRGTNNVFAALREADGGERQTKLRFGSRAQATAVDRRCA